MNNLIIWVIIGVGGMILGYIKYRSATVRDKEKSWVFNFNEIWNHVVGIFVGGTIIYYLISVRYPSVIRGDEIGASDFILLFVLILCLFGGLPYFIKNITEGINAIMVRILK